MKTRNSIFSFVVRFLSAIVTGVMSIIINNLIITNYGSDVNGLVATVGQVLNLLTIFEGGVTMATIVYLYGPYTRRDYSQINKTLSATNKIYRRLALSIFVISIIISFSSPYIISSNVDKFTISALFFMGSLQMVFSFLISNKYSIMFSVSNQEYKYGLITLSYTFLSMILSVVVLIANFPILIQRTIILIVPIIFTPLISFVSNRNFPLIDFNGNNPDYAILKNTKEVFVQKIASLLLSSSSIVILSIFINTKTASVYSVYNTIYMFIKLVLFSAFLAPLNAFGQLFSENNMEILKHKYGLYQLITIIMTSILLSTTYVLILPFIKLYTIGVEDINYTNFLYPIFFSLAVFLESLSTILGGFSNYIGAFKEAKKIVIIGTIANIVTGLSLVFTYDIIGILMSIIIAYLIMLIFQVLLVHNKILKNGPSGLIRYLLVNIALFTSIIVIKNQINFEYNSYLDFVLYGFSSVIIIGFLFGCVNLLIFKKLRKEIIIRIKHLIIIFNNNEKRRLK